MNRIHNLNSNDFNVLKFFVTVNENGVPKDLTGATVPRLAIRKPDGKAVFIDGEFTEVTKGKMTFSLGSQAVIASGNHTAEVMVYKGTAEILVTNPFVYHVNKGVLSDESLKSTNDYPAIIKAMQAGELLRDHDIDTLHRIAYIIDSIDGTGLQYKWDGTKLGVKREPDPDFSYVDLRGEKGQKGDTGTKGDTGAAGPQGERGYVGAKGDTGERGPTGNTGAKGDTGPALFTWIKYATSENGANMSNAPVAATTHIGIATNKTTSTMSTTPADYTWSNFKGAKGDTGATGATGPKGDKGDIGATGQKGDKGDKGDTGSGLKLLGVVTAVGDLPATGNSAGDGWMVGENLYVWNGTAWSNAGPIKGQKGDTGATGPAGPTGANGSNGASLYTWIKYATSAAGTGISDSPSGMTYIGIATNKTTATKSMTPGDYTWSLIKGDKGDTGAKGDKGDTGATGPAGSNGVTSVNNQTGDVTLPIGDLSALKTAEKSTLVGSVNELFQNVSDGKSVVATAITGKGVAASNADTFAQLGTKISTIKTGVETSDATAVETEIYTGKTAYVQGKKITGSMPNRGQTIITPSSDVQYIPGGYHNGLGYVNGDSNLRSRNIRAGVSLFGVTGDLNPTFFTTISQNVTIPSNSPRVTISFLVGFEAKYWMVYINNLVFGNYYGLQGAVGRMATGGAAGDGNELRHDTGSIGSTKTLVCWVHDGYSTYVSGDYVYFDLEFITKSDNFKGREAVTAQTINLRANFYG